MVIFVTNYIAGLIEFDIIISKAVNGLLWKAR